MITKIANSEDPNEPFDGFTIVVSYEDGSESIYQPLVGCSASLEVIIAFCQAELLK